MDSQILVLAGAPGAGKSTLGGALLRSRGLDYFSPSDYAREVLSKKRSSPEEALVDGWAEGVRRLRSAIERRSSYALETTLADVAIPKLLQEAFRLGYGVRVWYFGLSSLEQHQHRVRRRMVAGGYPVSEQTVAASWKRSREHLVALLPSLSALRLLDNSVERSSNAVTPPPRILMDLHGPQWIAPQLPSLVSTLDWAKPFVEAAIRTHGLPPSA